MQPKRNQTTIKFKKLVALIIYEIENSNEYLDKFKNEIEENLKALNELNSKLLTITLTKEEAIKIKYPEEAYANFCAFNKAFSMNEFEAASREMFLSNLNSALKVQRLREVEKLAGYKDTSRDCQ